MAHEWVRGISDSTETRLPVYREQRTSSEQPVGPFMPTTEVAVQFFEFINVTNLARGKTWERVDQSELKLSGYIGERKYEALRQQLSMFRNCLTDTIQQIAS